MKRDADWAEAKQRALAELKPGEEFYGLLPVLHPKPESGGSIVTAVLPLVLAAEAAESRRDRRRSAARSLFPLAPRMIFGVTDDRILIWSAGRRWRIGDFLGDVLLDRIVDAAAPTIGAGWRSVEIFLANEPTVTVQVPGSAADDLAATLRRRA